MAGHTSGRLAKYCITMTARQFLTRITLFWLFRLSDEFYALFYLGLYCEARGETTKASEYMSQAVRSEYANSIGRGDYMTAVARVRRYCACVMNLSTLISHFGETIDHHFALTWPRFIADCEVGLCRRSAPEESTVFWLQLESNWF